MNKKAIFTAAACLAASSGAMYGQTGEKAAAFQYFVNSDSGAANVSFRIEGMGGKIVKDKPFAGTEERETLQVLGDGTRISKKETDKYYRDAQGRTRIERNDGASVIIADPVSGTSTEMSANSKSARRVMQMRSSAPAMAAGTVTAGSPAPPQIVMMEKLKAEAGAIEKIKAEVDAAKTFTQSQTETMVYAKAGGPGEGGNSATEDLGTQLINGVSAQGTRTTITIPVGQIGNDREIKVVSERWFSPDLQMIVKSSNKDPRFGETTYQLVNVLQGAQDPTLFQVPSDFSVHGLK